MCRRPAGRSRSFSAITRTMRRTLRRATRAICLVLLWSFASTARRADAAELQIDWNGPPECSSASDLRARVTRLTDGAVQSDLQATVEVTHGEHDYLAHVVMRGRSWFGERRLEDARCDVLADSVAVLIALSIPTRATPDSADELSLGVGLEGRLASGSLPLMAAGIGGAFAVEGLSSLRLELHGGYYFPQSITFDQTTLGGNFELFTLGACVCRLWTFGIVHGGPCVGAEVHHIRASGFGGMTKLLGSTSWWGPSLRLFGRAQLWPAFGIDIALEGMMPVSRPQFVFSDVGELHRVSPVALQVLVGPEVRF
jgi:hypothetical protein